MDFNIEDTGVDPVSGFHTIVTTDTIGNYIPMGLSYDTGPPEKPVGWTTIPFNKTLGGVPIDLDYNAVVLTPEKIKYVREGNKAIKFTMAYVGANDSGYNDDTGYLIGISRNMPTVWRDWPHTPADDFVNNDGTLKISKYRGIPRARKRTADYLQPGDNHTDVYVYIQLQYVIDPADMFDYDQYKVKQIASKPSSYIRSTANWRVELIDDPGPGGYGIQ